MKRDLGMLCLGNNNDSPDRFDLVTDAVATKRFWWFWWKQSCLWL